MLHPRKPKVADILCGYSKSDKWPNTTCKESLKYALVHVRSCCRSRFRPSEFVVFCFSCQQTSLGNQLITKTNASKQWKKGGKNWHISLRQSGKKTYSLNNDYSICCPWKHPLPHLSGNNLYTCINKEKNHYTLFQHFTYCLVHSNIMVSS